MCVCLLCLVIVAMILNKHPELLKVLEKEVLMKHFMTDNVLHNKALATPGQLKTNQDEQQLGNSVYGIRQHLRHNPILDTRISVLLLLRP